MKLGDDFALAAHALVYAAHVKLVGNLAAELSGFPKLALLAAFVLGTGKVI